VAGLLGLLSREIRNAEGELPKDLISDLAPVGDSIHPCLDQVRGPGQSGFGDGPCRDIPGARETGTAPQRRYNPDGAGCGRREEWTMVEDPANQRVRGVDRGPGRGESCAR
jgi:hypothetical protein